MPAARRVSDVSDSSLANLTAAGKPRLWRECAGVLVPGWPLLPAIPAMHKNGQSEVLGAPGGFWARGGDGMRAGTDQL